MVAPEWPMVEPHARRDVVVIGTSAGGVAALPKLLMQLPGTFDASVLIVQHQGPREHAHLVHILQRSSTLPVTWAEQGEPLARGRVFVAPPDTHLAIHEDHLRLTRGPRENFSRPSIDRLFRSAAAQCGARTIGVLLTGMLADGVSGLVAIHECGGRTIVQDPHDAEFSELPTRALSELEPDAVLPVAAIGPALIDLVRELAPSVEPPMRVAFEHQLDAIGTASPRELDQVGTRVQQMCPECGGPLWKLAGPEHGRFRCYLGHVVNADALLEYADEQVESALWSAVRALHERAATWDALAVDARQGGSESLAADYVLRSREARDQAELARKFLLDLMRRVR
jgi:two-component system, chemotaxis family, protein-glutamate methylesterase/glutaminase